MRPTADKGGPKVPAAKCSKSPAATATYKFNGCVNKAVGTSCTAACAKGYSASGGAPTATCTQATAGAAPSWVLGTGACVTGAPSTLFLPLLPCSQLLPLPPHANTQRTVQLCECA